MGKADLHLHSTASDGRMDPEKLVEVAAGLKLSAISITDHDTIEGVKKGMAQARNHDIQVLPGVEITTDFDGNECHLLAYNFAVDDEPFNELLVENKNARVSRAGWIINQLRKKGMEASLDEAVAEAGGRNVGRPHIAEVLVSKGYVASHREAFIRHLSDEALGPIQSDYSPIASVIATVKAAGGVAILAHPGRMYTEEQLEALAAAGIDGLEVLHPSHNYEIQKNMEAFAEFHNLLWTGGSDFHGSEKSYYKYFGVLTINAGQVEKIKSLSVHRKKYSA